MSNNSDSHHSWRSKRSNIEIVQGIESSDNGKYSNK